MLLQNTRWKTVGRHVFLVQNMESPLFFVPLQLFEHHFLFNFCLPALVKESRALVYLPQPLHIDPC